MRMVSAKPEITEAHLSRPVRVCVVEENELREVVTVHATNRQPIGLDQSVQRGDMICGFAGSGTAEQMRWHCNL